MAEKRWRYKYKTVVTISWVYNELDKKEVSHKTALGHIGEKAPIDYERPIKEGSTCYIYSNDPIGGLELVDEDLEVGE